MAEQVGTPGSTADTSVNGGKAAAPKDKQCPFCHQQFTSSSLGRHLDLYIKEKNPKPPDGLHDVIEIRKIRGGITRRQPRNSMSRREDSTPAGTPGTQEPRSPPPELEIPRSPSLRRENVDPNYNRGREKIYLNKASWEATGVMNNIPPARNGDSIRGYDGEERDASRRAEGRNRSVSKQVLAKTAFDQKQKMVDALDNARAAELALRELMGSIRAAKQRIEGPSIFDYDPLSLDFPSLTLHCLPPPPMLQQSHPLATSSSWSILPPGEMQYQALRAHFSSAIHNWRNSCAIATMVPMEDLSYPPPASFQQMDDPSEIVQRAEAAAADLESKISDHLQQVFTRWSSLPTSKQTEIWTLELARSVGRKSEEVDKLRREKELAEQETAHLRLQVDELSRLQHPREFKLMPPGTLPLESKLMTDLAESSLNKSSIGYNYMDRNLHIDVVVQRAIGRWKGVVKEARGRNIGLNGQRSLSSDSTVGVSHISTPQAGGTGPQSLEPPQSQNHTSQTHNKNQNHAQHHTNSTVTNGADMGSDPDADADADMEEDYVDMNSISQRPPDNSANFRLTNGNSAQENGHGMEGLESPSIVGGYVRIPA